MFRLLSRSSLPQASTLAPKVDVLYDFILWISLISFVAVIGALIYFVFRYRRRTESDKTPYITGHSVAENAVAVGLLAVVMAIFAWGWIGYKEIIQSPAEALEIQILGRQWLWQVEYDNGRTLVNELVVPKGKPVQLIMTSADVLHSFYVPDFRLKQDLVPGAYTKLWFEATEAGEHQVFCAEYCGTAHAQMFAKVKVLEPEEYARWQAEGGQAQVAATTGGKKGAAHSVHLAVNLAEKGRQVFTQKGCMACHAVEKGKILVGPSLFGIFGKQETLADGSKVVVDENYLRESLMDPQLKLVKGFPPLMPTFRGVLTDEEVNALVAYVKSLK
ncbi:MAG: cytochrome c oxidase subunit II [Deltaproteobacteria bacterium]|nr:cytochrome c oxidase subunit II [Deltaproteobacteria bacterium]